MDALSHILEDIHLSSAEFLYVNACGDWGFCQQGHTTFHAVLQGDCILLLDEMELPLQAGDIVLMPAGDGHRLLRNKGQMHTVHDLNGDFQGHRTDPVNLGSGTVDTFLLTARCLMDQEMAKPLLSSLPSYLLIRQGQGGDVPEWLQLGLSFLQQETVSIRPGRDTLINRLMGMFLIECMRDYIENLSESDHNWLLAVSDPYLSPVLSAIHESPGRPWTVLELAGLACLSRSAFHDRFSDVVGMPPLTYLTNHRLRLAARLLALGELNIARISGRVGYKSEAAFSQAFRRQYQLTPSQYRKNRLEE